MTSHRRVRTLGAALLAWTTLAGCTSAGSPTLPAPVDQTPTDLPDGSRARVERVVDGDTIIVDGTRVRLIGIDAPESVKPDYPVECYGPEASAELKRLLPARTPVLLEYDRDRTDRYGRALAYVWLPDPPTLVNATLVREGFATVDTFPPNVRHVEAFEEAEASAREQRLGLWDTCR